MLPANQMLPIDFISRRLILTCTMSNISDSKHTESRWKFLYYRGKCHEEHQANGTEQKREKEKGLC